MGPIFDRMLTDHVRRLRNDPSAVARDARYQMMRLVRANQFDLIAEDCFTESWPKSITSNFIAQAAMDMAESLAPMPALNCASGSMNSSSAKNRAGTRTKIGHHYWETSNLKRHAVNAADWYFSAGFVPIIVEPDFELNMPKIRFEDPFMAYPEINRYGRTVSYVKVIKQRALTLAAMWPELHGVLCRDRYGADRGETELTVIRYTDKNCTVLYCEDTDTQGRFSPILLAEVENYLSRCPVEVACRPTMDGEIRGQYDDAIWPQIAKAKMMSLALEAGVKAVEAPIAVPQDLVELPIGPDAIWRTETPEKIRRVSLEIPQSAFAMSQELSEEMMRATRYPEARSGNISASVITGRGVDALMGSYDMLIKSAQDQLGEALAGATSIAFEMDEKVFGEVSKKIEGVSAGAPYSMTYKAKDDIRGDYSADVTYGLLAGLAPNNATVMALQLLGAGLISKEMVQKNLPFDVDVQSMTQAIIMERTRDAILEGVSMLPQTLATAAQMGQDPMQVVNQMAVFLTAIRKGADIEEAALKAFTPPEPPPGAAPEGDAMLEAEAAMGGGDPMMGGGMPEQPQALPDIQSLVASFRGGSASMSASTKRNSLL